MNFEVPSFEDEIGAGGCDGFNGAAPDSPPMPTADRLNIPPEAWGIHDHLPFVESVVEIDDSGRNEAATATAAYVTNDSGVVQLARA